MKQINVPNKLIKATTDVLVQDGHGDISAYHANLVICAFCKALSENPIVPTDEQHWDVQQTVQQQERVQGAPSYQGYVVEWQRRMFLSPSSPEDNPLVRGCPIGYGATEQEAIDDLKEQIEESK